VFNILFLFLKFYSNGNFLAVKIVQFYKQKFSDGKIFFDNLPTAQNFVWDYCPYFTGHDLLTLVVKQLGWFLWFLESGHFGW